MVVVVDIHAPVASKIIAIKTRMRFNKLSVFYSTRAALSTASRRKTIVVQFAASGESLLTV